MCVVFVLSLTAKYRDIVGTFLSAAKLPDLRRFAFVCTSRDATVLHG